MIVAEIFDRVCHSLGMESGEGEAVLFLRKDTVCKKRGNGRAIFRAKGRLLIPRAGGGRDDVKGWVMPARAANQELFAEKVQLLLNRENFRFLMEIFDPRRRDATGD